MFWSDWFALLWVPTLGTDPGYRPWVPTLGTDPGYRPWVPTLGTDPGVAVCDHDIIGFATGAAYTFVACLLVLSVIAVVTFANNCCKRSATARVQMPLV